MRFCKDCAHFAGKNAQTECLHPNNPKTVDVVMGTTDYQWHSAAAVRVDEHLCGSAAAWFEPRADEPEAAQAAA